MSDPAGIRCVPQGGAADTVRPVMLGRVTIVGLGLMGGSLAMAMRRAGIVNHIVACDRSELLSHAKQLRVIDSGFEDVCESAAQSDFILLCTPVETSIAMMRQVAPHLKPGALITDVGSTKQSFAAAAREIFGPSAFERVLPGHPLAGRELSGLEHASADLYDGCLWIFTPLAPVAGAASVAAYPPAPSAGSSSAEQQTPAHHLLYRAIESLGARIAISTPEQHDCTLAYTSHLPQMVSTALALTLTQTFAADDPALQLHAGGLRSMLRLAASDPAMWEQIAASNRENLAAALEKMEAELRDLRAKLGTPEFRESFERARELAKLLKK